MRTVQWILHRMRYTQRDVQDVVRDGATDHDRQRLASSAQYSNPLKRSAEQWDQDDMPTLKLPRPNASHFDTSSGERRGSIDFAARDPIQRLAYSPAQSDSAPGSAYPRQGSPISGKLPRALPSPSSLAFPLSGAASFVPANSGSVGSPGTSYHPASSIHTVSTTSATSAHLQDLQHQVSLKSLALQTLQTEYATLLQKLQRERIKSQTIEKKTTVADQEVNDLTTRNEEMTEQIKSLEVQLQDCERKRECERADAAKEKNQWGRMLDMSGRLQNKSASDYQRVAKEKADLLQRLAVYENGSRPTAHIGQSDLSRQTSRSSPPNAGDAANLTTVAHSVAASNDADVLRRENRALQAKVSLMHSSLEELRRQYLALEEGIEHVVSRKDSLRKSMDEVVGHSVRSTAKTTTYDMAALPNKPATSLPEAPPNSIAAPTVALPSPQAVLSSSAPNANSGGNRTDPFSRENLAHIARAVSPGPAELGFHVQSSTSSPEELIQALGPVPAPLPSIRYPSSPHVEWPSSGAGTSRQQGRRQSQPFVAPLSLTQNTEHTFPPVSSFRPLNHTLPPHHQGGQYSGASPHSHHSSPGPNLSDNSSPSSASTHYPEHRVADARGEYGFARRHSQPQLTTLPSTAAMPPPPRPMP